MTGSRHEVADLLRERYDATIGDEEGMLSAVADALARYAAENLDAAAVDALEDAVVSEVQILRGRQDRDPLGLVLTPPAVAEALGALLALDGAADIDVVLDPACGTGRLLDGVVRTCAPGAARVGWDVDPVPLTVARALAALRARAMPVADLSLSQADGLVERRPATAADSLVVVCNPPFVAAYARRSQAASMDRVRLAEVAHGWGEGRLNTATAFVARAVRDLCRPGEFAGFVLPDALLSSPRYAAFRTALLAHVDAMTIGRLPENAFRGRGLRAVLVVVRRAERLALEAEPDAPRLDEIAFRTWDGEWSAAELLPIDAVRSTSAHIIPWPARRTREAFGLVAGGHRLDAAFTVSDGVNPGGAEARAALVSSSSRGMSRPHPLVEGRDIQPGHVSAPAAWLETDPARILPEWRRGGTSLRRPGLFDGPRLYSRQTADRIVCGFIDDESFALNSVHVIRWAGRAADAAAQLRRLSAVLSTELVAELYQALFAEDRAAFPQVKVVNLRGLPIPWPPPEPLAEAADRWAEAPSPGRLRHVETLVERWLLGGDEDQAGDSQ